MKANEPGCSGEWLGGEFRQRGLEKGSVAAQQGAQHERRGQPANGAQMAHDFKRPLNAVVPGGLQSDVRDGPLAGLPPQPLRPVLR